MTTPSNDPAPSTHKLTGGCHCGAVRYEAVLDLSKGGTRCNCTICTMIGATAAIVRPDDFRLLSGEESLGVYEWGGKISRRHFCTRCGIHAFARGHLKELGGDYVSVNLNTVDGLDPWKLPVVYWDGRHNNWYAGPRPTPWPVEASAS